jgi:hypothetical protein
VARAIVWTSISPALRCFTRAEEADTAAGSEDYASWHANPAKRCGIQLRRGDMVEYEGNRTKTVRACSGCRECVARMTAAAFVAELLVGFLAGVVALLVFAARHPKKPQRNDDGGLKHRQPIHRTSIDLR